MPAYISTCLINWEVITGAEFTTYNYLEFPTQKKCHYISEQPCDTKYVHAILLNKVVNDEDLQQLSLSEMFLLWLLTVALLEWNYHDSIC